MSDQSDSDGLPYTQLDRSAKPKAAMLSTILGVTYQHGIGGLAEFWELCGEPRELERLILSGQDAVILDGADLERRFELGMGRPLSADRLVGLGLAQALPDGRFRVRGMSRYLDPIRRRIQAREAAVAGGKASAAARKAKNGSAQPPNHHRSDGSGNTEAASKRSVREDDGAAPDAPRSGGSTGTEAHFEEPRTPVEADTEAPPNTAVSGQRSGKDRSLREPLDLTPPEPKRRKESEAEEWFAIAVEAERRRKISEDSGMREAEVAPLMEQEKLNSAYVNAAVKRLRTITSLPLFPHDDRPDELSLASVYGAYLEDPANATRNPPYSFRYFASEPVATKYFDRVRR